MNCKQAQQIDIVDYLLKLGYRPINVRNTRYRFKSPLRPQDNKPSFDVDLDKNMFIDWGTGQTGDIITLVKLLHNTDTKNALQILSGFNDNKIIQKNDFSFIKQNLFNKSSTKQKTGRLQKIKDSRLINYLYLRRIPEWVWKECRYLFEYRYYYNDNPKKEFTNLAWKNDLGGLELNIKNKGKPFKSCISPKSITTIKGEGDNLNLFEGFFDYLSSLTYYGVSDLPGTTIVLNTTAMLIKAEILFPKFKKINLFLDNDQTGKRLAAQLKQKYKEKIENYSQIIYPNHKDFNDYIVKTKYQKK